jgi:hypothetical protein
VVWAQGEEKKHGAWHFVRDETREAVPANWPRSRCVPAREPIGCAFVDARSSRRAAALSHPGIGARLRSPCQAVWCRVALELLLLTNWGRACA